MAKFYTSETRLATHSDPRLAAIQNSIPLHIGRRKKFTFMTGRDLYALRCAYLHEGSDEINNQDVKETLKRFIFRQPPNGCTFHNNLREGEALQIQVSVFARQVIEAIKDWLDDIKDDQVKIEKINNLATINFSSNFTL